MPEESPNPNVIVVPTNDPGATEAEYVTRGWKCCDLLAGPWHRELCAGKRWALRMWRPEPVKQGELL